MAFVYKLKNYSRQHSKKLGTLIEPIVTVKDGRLRGAVGKLCDGSDYYSFKGIPYAQPPVGKLRFKAPLPAKPWEGILNALEHGPVCPQVSPTREIIEGDEHCLFLNVYTRSLKNDSKIPVMVFVHGGALTQGSGNDDYYGPEFLLEHNIILVTLNYRLEAFGFLCLDTPEVPGNAGLKDQVIALRWVQSNISQFGGDPENVTIFGESAGAALVTYHMMSPMSKGLFSKSIAQSGNCLCDWTMDYDAKARAFRTGRVLGKDTTDTDELLEFLQSVPAKNLIGMSNKVATKEEKLKDMPIYFRPVVEKEFVNTEAFVAEHPLDLMLSGRYNPIPFMTGYNSVEGLSFANMELKKIDIKNKFPSFFAPSEIARKVSGEKLSEIGDRIKLFYSGGRDFTSKDIDIITNMLSDMYITFGAYRMVNIYSALCKSTYLYRFNLDSELNVYKDLFGVTKYKGACHGDDLFYLFKTPMNEDFYHEQEKLRGYVSMVTRMWTNFAKTGNPTPDNTFGVQWSPYTPGNKCLLNIDEKLAMKVNPEGKRIEFWNDLYNEIGLPITATNDKR